MTTKEYKRMCRIRVTRLSKFITYISLMSFFSLAYFIDLSGYITAAISTTIWLYMPDLSAYVLESVHKINHDFISYR